MAELFILRTDKSWMSLKTHESRHCPIYKYVLLVFNALEIEHNKLNTELVPKNYNSRFESNDIVIEILVVQSHRHCSILICMQRDNKTGGLRYIVYGIRKYGQEDYGIGKTLEGFAEYDADKYVSLIPNGCCYKKYIDVSPPQF